MKINYNKENSFKNNAKVDCIWNENNTFIPMNNDDDHFPMTCQSNLDEDDDNVSTMLDDYEDHDNVVTVFNND